MPCLKNECYAGVPIRNKTIQDEQFILDQEQESLKKLSAQFGYAHGGVFGLFSSAKAAYDVDKALQYKMKALDAVREEYADSAAKRLVAIDHNKQLLAAVESQEIQAVEASSDEGVQAKKGFVRAVYDVPAAILSYPVKVLLPEGASEYEKFERKEKGLLRQKEEIETALDDLDVLLSNLEKEESEQIVVDTPKPENSDTSKREVRRRIKKIEKQINEQYKSIDDSEAEKHRLAKDLLTEIKHVKRTRRNIFTRIGSGVLKPFAYIGRGFNMFFFGIKGEDVVAQDQAQQISGEEEVEQLDDDALYKALDAKITIQNEVVANKKKQAHDMKVKLEKVTQELTKQKASLSSFMKDMSKLADDLMHPSAKPKEAKSDKAKRKVSVPEIESKNIKNPLYSKYYQNIRSRIREKAYRNYEQFDAGEIYITFIIQSDGILRDIKIIEDRTSANQYLRRISIRSVQQASPFPPFPEDLKYPCH